LAAGGLDDRGPFQLDHFRRRWLWPAAGNKCSKANTDDQQFCFHDFPQCRRSALCVNEILLPCEYQAKRWPVLVASHCSLKPYSRQGRQGREGEAEEVLQPADHSLFGEGFFEAGISNSFALLADFA
jgi:hypothetical protein